MVQQFQENDFEQIFKIQEDGSLTELNEYTYDHSGVRVKTYNMVKNETTYTPFREFKMVVNSSGTFNYTYVYEGDVLVAKINPDGSKYFYHADSLGSTSLITDEGGEVVEEVWYLPYGEPMGETSETKLYEGEEYDSSTGEYDYEFRNYDPELRIFTRADSILPDVYDPQQLNRYMFERGNPFSYVDEDGHVACGGACIIGGLILARGAIGSVLSVVDYSLEQSFSGNEIDSSELPSKIGYGFAKGVTLGVIDAGLIMSGSGALAVAIEVSVAGVEYEQANTIDDEVVVHENSANFQESEKDVYGPVQYSENNYKGGSA